MRLHGKIWAFVAVLAVVGSLAATALAIEAFQERFEWGDMSKPTSIQGRVIILDPYDEAVWLNVAVFGGNAESGYFWQKVHPGKNLKFYAANKEVWDQLKNLARPHAGPAAAKEVPPATSAALVEIVAQEVEQNRRVIQSVKKLEDVSGEPGKTKSISALRLKECSGKHNEYDKECYQAKQGLNSAPKGADKLPMHYDVLIPGGKPVAGLIPWTALYNEAGH